MSRLELEPRSAKAMGGQSQEEQREACQGKSSSGRRVEPVLETCGNRLPWVSKVVSCHLLRGQAELPAVGPQEQRLNTDNKTYLFYLN